MLTKSQTSDITRETIVVSWGKPRRSHYKLNMNSMSLGNPEAGGIGGAFRDSSGNWFLGFMKGVRKATNNRTELWDLLYGLRIAWKITTCLDRLTLTS